MAQQLKLDNTEWMKFLDTVSSNTRRVIEYLKAAASTIGFSDIISHFNTESGPGGSWPKRSPETDRIYDLIGAGKLAPPRGFRAGSFSSSNKLLQLTGKMRQSVMPGRGGIKVVSGNSIRMSAGTNYSAKHDEGGGRTPQREFMWLSDKAQQLMANFVRDKYLEGT